LAAELRRLPVDGIGSNWVTVTTSFTFLGGFPRASLQRTHPSVGSDTGSATAAESRDDRTVRHQHAALFFLSEIRNSRYLSSHDDGDAKSSGNAPPRLPGEGPLAA